MSVLLIVVGVVLGGLVGAAVPEIIERIPEPVDPPADEDTSLDEGAAGATGEVIAEPAPQAESERESEPEAEAEAEEDPKELYAEMARLPWLRAVGALLGAAMGGLFAAGAPDWSLLWLWPLVPVLVALSIIDARTRLLPKILVLPATLFAIVMVVIVGLATGEGDQVVRALLAMVVLRTFYWILWFIHSAGLGFGDVRYSALLGVILGWVGWGALAVASMISLLSFVIGPLVVLVVTRDTAVLKRAIAFGPFMTLGAVAGLGWGPQIAAYIWG